MCQGWAIICAASTLYAFLAGEEMKGNWGVFLLGGFIWIGGSFLIVAFNNPERPEPSRCTHPEADEEELLAWSTGYYPVAVAEVIALLFEVMWIPDGGVWVGETGK